jgi:hypothetical protein
MPLLRYFLYVGGALLSVILISSAVMPQVPLPSTLMSASDLPSVRIHTDRKLPERVVFDTSSTVSSGPIPMLAPANVASTNTPSTQQVTAAPASVAEISPKARVREAFAQLPQDADISEPKMTSKSLPKRKVVARPKTTQPLMMVAQQPRFGQATW